MRWPRRGRGRGVANVGIFGPSKAEVWQQLCREIGADFIDGGLWKGQKVEAHADPWTVTLDTFTVSTGKSTATFTRMRAPYVNHDGFRFRIYRKGLFSEIGKLFGMQDLETGYPEFDDAFIIKSNDPMRVRTLFSNEKIRRLFEAQRYIYLEVRDDEGWFRPQFPEGVDELYFQVGGVLRDVEVLKGLFELFAETLDWLTAMGSAERRDPGVQL